MAGFSKRGFDAGRVVQNKAIRSGVGAGRGGVVLDRYRPRGEARGAPVHAYWIEGVYPGKLYDDTAVSKLLVSSDPAR
jgi:hypothetical protein